MADEAVYSGVGQMPYPTTEHWRRRLEAQAAAERDELHLVAVADGAGSASAGIHLFPGTPRRRHLGSRGMSVAATWQGRGLGTGLMNALLDWADNWIGLLRIELTVYTDNMRAIALYEKFGLIHEGTPAPLRCVMAEFVDAHAMARLHPHPPGLNR